MWMSRSTNNFPTSGSRKGSSAATPSNRTVFVLTKTNNGTTNRATTPSIYPLSSWSRRPFQTPSARKSNETSPLSLLSTAASSKTTSTGTTNSECIIDSQETILNDADDATSHTKDEDLFDGEEDEVVFPKTPADDAVLCSLLPRHAPLKQEQLVEFESTPMPSEWYGLNPDVVLRCLKSVNTESL
jgi:hypothetical protein